MAANSLHTENDLAEAAIAWLRERIPDAWEISRSNRAGAQGADDPLGLVYEVRGGSGANTTIVVEAQHAIGPRDIDRFLGPVGQTLRTMSGPIPILVVSEWLSERTQERLREQRLNYIDLTGNALVQLDYPTLFLQTQGASKNPAPVERGPARIQGPKSARLIRILADVQPPYGIRDLARAAGLTPGYTSRLIQALDDDALIERSRRGEILAVDVPRVLRRWTATYDVFRSNTTTWGLARAGVGGLLDDLRNAAPRVAITGSFAAARLAPVAAPRLLVAYTSAPAELLQLMDILPVDDGANVALLQPADDVVWRRTTEADGHTYVAPSQAVVDCLTGNGRMPSEGEALLDWMTANEATWRLQALPTYEEPSR